MGHARECAVSGRHTKDTTYGPSGLARLGATSLLCGMVLAPLAGCAEEPPTGVRLVVTTDLAVPDELDELVVTIVASPSAAADGLCRPVTLNVSAAEASAFPFELLVDKGTLYAGWIAFRVDGRRGGTLVQRREMRVAWPVSDVVDVPADLFRSCVERVPLCPEECIEGLCVDWVAPEGIFDDDNPLIAPGAPDCFAER